MRVDPRDPRQLQATPLHELLGPEGPCQVAYHNHIPILTKFSYLHASVYITCGVESNAVHTNVYARRLRARTTELPELHVSLHLCTHLGIELPGCR